MASQRALQFSGVVEHEQIQKRTFTNWINSQLAKRCPPSFVSDLFSDLRDGSQLLDLLEVMSGQSMKRERGRGVFKQRANIETALNFLKKKSIKLVNINIPDIIDGRPSIILGLVWTIILHCHIEELASALSFSSRHSSLDSLASVDSWSGSPVPAGPVPAGRTSPLHRRFRMSAKKALLMWVREQCQRVGSSVSVKDFKSSWRTGEAFLAILCSLRPQLVDLSLVQHRSNQENLEEAFHLASRELHIPRLLEPQDVDVNDPDEKSIMTYVAQFLQYSNDMPAPDDHLQLFPLDPPSCFSPVTLPAHFTPAIAISPLRQVSPSERAQEVTCWLQQAFQELSEAWAAAGNSTYTEKYQVLHSLTGPFTEQRRPVMTLLATIRRCPELSQAHHALRASWDRLEEEVQRCKADLDLSLPRPLDSVVVWLQRAEAALTEEGGRVKDHAEAAKEARAQQDTLKALIKEMNHHVQILDDYPNTDDSGNVVVPLEKFDEIKRRVTHIRVTAKYQGIKLEYQECRHTVLDLLLCIKAKIQAWKTPYRSKEAIHVLLQDWHETVERRGMLLILMDTLQNLKEKANAYTSKAALGEKSQLVNRQVKEAESEAELVTQAVRTVRGRMEKVVSAWETYNNCLTSLHSWLAQTTQSQTQSPAVGTQDVSEWMSCQAKLNEVGNLLIEVTETSTSRTLAEQLSRVNMQWAEFMKRTKFGIASEPSVGPPNLHVVHSLIQEATCLLRQPLDVASVPLKANRQKLQLLSKKMAEVDMLSLSSSPDFQTSHIENFPQMLAEAERTCGELQRAASRLEGRLAEMAHWSTDALDCYQHLKEREHRGHSALDSTAKVLISRGVQLENQVVTEGRDLQDFVERVQRTCPLQHLSTSGMQDRISEKVSHCQEILGMFSSFGYKWHKGEPVPPTQRQPETGLFVVARTKHVEQTGNVKLQTQNPSQLPPQIPSHIPQPTTRDPWVWPKDQHTSTQDETAIVKIQMLPQPLREPVPHFNSSLAQSVKEAESKPESLTQASSQSQNHQPLASLTKATVGPTFQKSLVVSEHATSAVTGEKERSPPSQTKESKSRIRGQPKTLQNNKASPQPPVMVRSEVHSKAQSMARSRLEKARVRVQGRIQQAIKLFGGKEISESQAKKKQAATDEAASFEESVESLRELRETLTPSNSSCLATDQLKESDEAPETQPSDTALPAHSRGQQLGGNTPLRATGMTADTQPGSNLPQKQSIDSPQQDLSPVAGSVPLCGDILPLRSQDATTERKDHLTQHRGSGLGQNRKPSLRAQEQLLKAHLLHTAESNQQGQAHIQAVVRGDTVETKQEAEWTVIPEAVAPPQQEEHPSEQEVLERYRESCLVFQSQLQKNKQHLEEFVPEPVTICTLQNQKKQLQTLKQETDALWFELEQQYAHLTQSLHLKIREDLSEVEKVWEQVTQEWRGQQMCLKNRMTSLENTADLMESADDQIALITQRLDGIMRESIDIRSFNLADTSLQSDLKEMDDRLQSQMRKLSKQSSEVEKQHPEAISLHQALQSSVSHLQQLRQQLEKVQLAARAVDHFLATMREVKAEIPALLADQDASRQQNEANWEQERHSWQAAMQQRLQTAAEQCDSVDSSLKAAGITLTMDGVTVTCQDVVTSLSKHAVDVEKKLMRARQKESRDEINPVGKGQMQRNEELNPMEIRQTKTGDDSVQQGGAQEQGQPPPSGAEEESGLEAKRSRLNGENDTKTQRKEEHKAQTWKSEGDQRRRRNSHGKKEGEEKGSLVQRRAALLGALREIRGAAEHLGLREPTLPALQQRTRALTELESRLAGLLSELQDIQQASSSGISEVSQSTEVEGVWEETTKAVTERLEQCCVLTELLKVFQSTRGKLSGTLQRAESTISEQASYMGRDNLQRLHTKVQETKDELNALGDGIEEVRSVCRQLHTHLRQMPECTIIPFESEADTLMDSWLDISERTDSHLENLHRSLTLWDGVLQLGAEVESWADNKLAVFAQSPSFQSEDDIKTLQNEIVAQEKTVERFQQRATEIQSLLQSPEPPLELQVAETQMRKKIEQLKELGSEAEDVYRQLVAAKGQITSRMVECFSSLQKIQDSLLTLSGSDVATVLAKLKELCWQLQTQDEQAESLLEDLRVMTSVAGPDSLQTLFADGIQLQEKVRNSHQLFSEVEEQTQRNIQDLDRLQRESERLEQWLQDAEEKTVREDLSLLQEESLKQRARTELVSQLVSSLQSSNLQQSALVQESNKLLERYHSFHTNMLHGAKEKQSSLSGDIDAFQALLNSPQSSVGGLRRLVDSPLGESSVEQRLHRAQAVVSATADGEARLEVLRATGNGLSHRLCDEDDLKQEIQETIQKTEEQWSDLLQSAEPYHRILQTDPELTSSYLARRQEVCCGVEELQRQIAQLPTLFPWPGTAERRQAFLVARQLWDESKALQLTLTSLAEQQRELGERASDAIWKDSSWAELDGRCSSLMAELKDVCCRLEEGVSNEEHFDQLLQDCHHKLTSLQERMSSCQTQKDSSAVLSTDAPALEALLQEVTDTEKDILQLVTLKDSITDSSTVEAQASLSQQVSNLQNHRRALDGSIRENLALLTENTNQRVQQVKEEVFSVQTALKDLAENVGDLCENHELLPNISQLKQQWCTLQDFDTRLTELAARVYSLQNPGESGITLEILPAGVIVNVDGAAKDLDSFRSIFLQRKQECAENTANRVRQVIRQLQEWSQTVQAEPPSPSQAALDEGLQLQQSLCEVLSEKDFLLNCLGTKVSENLKKNASDSLYESTSAFETLSKCLVSEGHSEVEMDKGLQLETVGEAFRRDAPHSATPDEMMAMCPPASPSLSATDKENSESDQNDNKMISKGTSTTLGKHHPSTELVTNTSGGFNVEADAAREGETCISMEQIDISSICTSDSLVQTAKKDALVPNQVPSAKIPNIFSSETQQESQQLTPSPPKIGHRTLSVNNTEPLMSVQSETFKAPTDAQEQEKPCEDINVSPQKVFTIVLDMELPVYQSQDTQQRESVGASSPEVLTCSEGTELTEVSSTGLPEKTLISPKPDETDFKGHCLKSLKSNVSQGADSESGSPSVLMSTELQSANAKVSCKENLETPELMHNEVLNSSKSCGSVTECQLTGTHAAETTFPNVKQEEVTDFCHTEKQTMSSVLCTVESSVQTGDALTKTHISAGDSKQTMGADTAESTGTGHAEMAEGENTEEASDPEGPESTHSEVPERENNTSLLQEESESKLPATLEDTEVTQGQLQEDMEPRRTVLGLSADRGAGETTGGSPASSKHRPTMQDILSEIQSLVEGSNIINRTPHIDLNWYLKSSPGEPEIRLVRTVQQVLACRYQPAQLDITAMAKQLEEAEEYRCCVQEQIATMKSMRVSDPDALERAEGQWSAALLDASATVQVKAAQLDQVTQYHKQMKMTRAFLQVLAAEKEKMSLNALGSSAVQADKLHVLLQTMEQKKGVMEELLHLSSQLSVHLSDTESSGALLAQLGDVQEEWRLLEGSIKRALQHATNSTCQSSLLIKEVEQLKAKLKALQKSNFQSNDIKSTLEFICQTTDLKLYNQLYLHLQSQADAFVHFSLGQKEKDEIQCNLQELASLLNVTKTKLHTSTYSRGDISSTKINKQLQDLVIWAKQAENHISTGKKLALFPEEARIQIADMKKFQTDILSRRSKMQVQVEEMKDVASDMEKEESDQALKTIEDLYEATADSLDHVLETMKKRLQEREKLLSQLASMDAWLAETHATRDPCAHVENVSKADIQKLESELESHKLATVEIQSQLNLVEEMAESCKDIAAGLSPGESRYLVNRLSGLWTELDGLLAHERAISWELEELIHQRTSSDEELSTVQASLKQVAADLEQQKFPLTQETISTVVLLKHMLMESQCQVQELQHCHEAKRSALLYTIGELLDRCKALSLNAFEQDKYLHLRRQMEESRDIAKEQIQRAKDKSISVGDRFRQYQTLLVELPLVKTQCQEAGDQLEAIAQELYPSELNSERQRIHRTVEALVSWEHSATDDIKNLETKLLLGLRFSSELPALIELFQRTRGELQGAEPVCPDEKAIDSALRRYWVIWRNMESGMRVLEALGRKEKVNLKNYKELYSLRDAAMQECHLRMESLSQARESLKDYHWAAQGAIAFLHNAEATFLSAPGGFLDCTEEQRQTQQALEALEDGFQAHICHIVELVPQQPCLSRPNAEQLHISILSQLLVGRAVLEAQAQLRLESLQRCAVRQQSHRSCHEDLRQHLSGFEARLSECAAAQVTSFDKCVAQQGRAMLLMEDLHNLAGKIEDLRAGCPMQGCGVGKDGELGALWRRWVSLRRGVGRLMAHSEQRQEEWKDITTSMEQCCSFLASLQAEVPDSSTVSFTQEKPQDLLAQAEMHQAGLEQEQQALASLEHRLEHALSLSSSQEPISPGPVGKTLMKIQENVRSLKERNLLVVAAAQAEEKERQQVQEEIGEVEKHTLALLSALEASSNPRKQQELRKDWSSLKAKLECIMDGVQSRYAEIPADISKHLQEVQLSLQRAEEKLTEGSNPVRKLAGQVKELCSGLESVKMLLEQKSPTVNEAENVLKHVWDELDAWHSRLMLLESEVQDLAEEQPEQAHLLLDQLTQPLQLYQNTSQMAEHHTSFLSKIPACLQEFEDILYSATCWLDEAQSWLSAPCSFTTARSLQNHAKSLQLVLDDSERIRDTLQNFRPVLAEISAVCDVSTQEERLDQNGQQVHNMQRNILEPLEQLLQAAVAVEAMEAELKTMEKNVPKIRTILSSMENANITLTKHLHNRQVILANVQSMRRTLEEVDRCKGELHLPQGAEDSLLVFSRARLLLQPLEELEQLTQQQVSLLEKTREEEEEETSKDLGVTTVSNFPEEMQQLDRPPRRHLVKDPEETLNLSDVKSEDTEEMNPLSNVEELESLALQFSSEVETSPEGAEAGLLPVRPGGDTNDFGSKNVVTGLITVDSKAEHQFAAAAPQDQHDSPKHETLDTATCAAAIEDTRLIPSRPITPFTAARASVELIEEGDEDLSLSTVPHQDLDPLKDLREQNEVRNSENSLVKESQQVQESSKAPVSLAGHEEDEKEQLRWTRLYNQISQKLTTLKKVQEEHQTSVSSGDAATHEKVPLKELMSTGSASAILQRTHESIAVLRQIVKSADSSHPGVKEDLYEALRRVLLCLDSWTDFLLTPGGAGEDEAQLRLLQQECVSAELETLNELLNKVESETSPGLWKEEPDAYRCLTCLQDCLRTVQLVSTSSNNQLTEDLGLKKQHQEFFNQLCILDEFELGQREIFPSLKEAPSLEQCVLGRHLRESPGETAKRSNRQQFFSVKSADSSHPGVKEDLYEALRRVLLCLDSWTDFLLTPGGAGEDEAQLRLLQQEVTDQNAAQCVSAELETLNELLNKVESETSPGLWKEEPDAYRCLTCLQDCLRTVQLVSTSSNNQLTEDLGLKKQHQEFFNQLCILDEFELGQREIFPSLKEAPSLEQCVLGRHLRESPGETAKLQQVARSLLQGVTCLLELGEECIKERQISQVHNRSQLQAVLCRHKNLLQVLGSQLAFVQHLFQREPEVLKCQEDKRLQLEVRAKALQQQALEQEVASQRRLQEWTLWEDNCGQLGRVLDESEALISSGEPEGDEEEFVIQHRLDACQQTLVQLDERRAALGLLLDQCKVLQAEPVFSASVSQAGGALELRWRSAFRRTEQEIQRCRDIQDLRARFQTGFATVSKWLVAANKHLKTWSDLADTSDLSQECVHNNLIKLLVRLLYLLITFPYD
ncbi:nesprin-2a [Toxotes jaculatrix]|uniref:nesprin-2a n=1 Tax=Toxotes jaculatrix TaxID=941984 RepID=UPI001B3A8FB4|nr:nesprin-2a [Toxotes jaculatrix]